MTELKICLWNCSGLRAVTDSTAHKMGFFDKELPNANFAISVFVETHHRGEEDFPDLINEYQTTHTILHTPTPLDETHAGIIVLIRKDLEILKSCVKIPGRFLNVHFRDKVSDKVFNLTAFYGPQFKRIRKKDLHLTFEHFFSCHSKTDNNIVLGDFNFVDFDLDKGQGMDQQDNLIKQYWEDFKNKTRIVDPFREQNPSTKVFSYHTKLGKSRIDRVYVNVDHVFNVRHISYKYYSKANAHKLFTFTFTSPDEKGPGYWKLNTSVLNDVPYYKLISDVISRTKALIAKDPTEWWEILLFNVRSKTLWYTEQKKYRESKLKKDLERELTYLESFSMRTMPPLLAERLSFVQNQLKKQEEKEIEGHRIRTRNLPNFEKSDPNISFFSKLERRYIRKSRIGSLKDKDGNSVSDTKGLLTVVSNFYSSLFSSCTTNPNSQDALLKNIKKKISSEHRDSLDAPLTADELQEAVNSLNKEKSPGINGLPAEFYQIFWPQIKDRYLQFVNHAFLTSFPITLNTSVTTLIYKERGDIEDIANYRPLSLINTDVKILSKALTTRLKYVLPTIIHKTQTAVDGRQIDHTVHLLRDLIDLANKENLDAAFIFLDQEKAFDRVDHDFLYRTMSAFGIGDNFIHWVRQIYSTAVTRVKLNGFLTGPIPLMRGVRQGDPLSFFLYVLNSELFALQIRQNQNIVGFIVGGEKIVSMHYADDTTITITQNRCFKEVIKDIRLYEQATGAKANISKTKGLWCGSWRHRQDLPLGIKWTNKNIFHLGIFVGNDEPAKKTFEMLIPKIKNSLNFWKPLKLSALSKARVIEIFHASRLWYAAKFYSIPGPHVEILQKAFLEYLNHPFKQTSVRQIELMKLKLDGGIKLINVQHKSEASKVQWLMSICTNPGLSLHKALVERMFGVQRGGLTGIELFFATKHYARNNCNYPSIFYKEAIYAMTSLHVEKQIFDRFEEKMFYNPTFRDDNDHVLIPNKICLDKRYFTYQQFIHEQGKKNRGEQYLKSVVSILDKLKVKDFQERDDFFFYTSQGKLPFCKVTQKLLYEEILKIQVYKEHHSELKWLEKLNTALDWKQIWKTIHNRLCTNDTVSQVWDQVHLNGYTTASYSKWFKKTMSCPLCKEDIIDNDCFHLILNCAFSKQLWCDINPFLLKLYPAPVTAEEMSFGLYGTSPFVVVRNWLTFLLRECIIKQEKAAFHNDLGMGNIVHLRHTFNARVVQEVCDAYERLKHDQRMDIFHSTYNPGRVFLVNPNREVQAENIVRVIQVLDP